MLSKVNITIAPNEGMKKLSGQPQGDRRSTGSGTKPTGPAAMALQVC